MKVVRNVVTAYNGKLPYAGFATFADGREFRWYVGDASRIVFIWQSRINKRYCRFVCAAMAAALIDSMFSTKLPIVWHAKPRVLLGKLSKEVAINLARIGKRWQLEHY